jgi:hypothetical protein
MEVRPMPTVSRSPAWHYANAERLVNAVPESPDSAPLLAICHALLAAAPRRARRAPQPPGRSNELPPSLSWGDEQQG